jgi:hypothetical protein
MPPMDNLIGGAWLVQRYGLRLGFGLVSRSSVGGRRATQVDQQGMQVETYVEAMRPEATLKGHLTFHLKHENPSLELLDRLFAACDPAELAQWVRAEPTGQYARRAGFLYEWLTGRQLPVEGARHGAYVDALDPARVVVASPSEAVRAQRWRVRDNMPGTTAFCPMVRKTPQSIEAMGLNVAQLLAELTEEFGEELLLRSAVWMTLRESRSSFAIEGEADQTARIQRFAAVLGRRTGQAEAPLSDAALAGLQADILGPRTSLRRFGLRQSPVFVGQSIRLQEVVHYVAPPAQDLDPMLRGLVTFLDRTRGQSAVMRSAVASFGFVYIHPLADGNGRVHRFLVNDVLRRDGAVPSPLLLPVSTLIASESAERRAYDRILEAVSRPLMNVIAGHYRFGASITYPDGVRSNLHLDDPDLARPLWRRPDLTAHVVYLADLIARTVRSDMREESRYLRGHARARAAIKDLIEMPDQQVDRVIRSIEANHGTLTKVLAREIPALGRPEVWEAMVLAVQAAFRDGASDASRPE